MSATVATPRYARGTDVDDKQQRRLRRFFGTNVGSLLDVGCGTGRTSLLLAARFPRLAAFDVVPEMIAVAEARRRQHDVPVRFLVADATCVPARDASFDRALYFNSEVRRRAGRTEPAFRAHFHRWDHFYACEKAATAAGARGGRER